MEIVIIVAVILVVIVGGMWVVMATISEAERKLKRELRMGELVFGAITSPYSLVYVWWVMPEPKRSRE